MRVVLNTAQAVDLQGYVGTHPVGSTIPVYRTADGRAFVEIRDIQPSEVLVLTNHPEPDEGAIL
jgi:hypothetical protein